jgi:uncharacterized protein with von Willebrand factor type A (vWA) domain
MVKRMRSRMHGLYSIHQTRELAMYTANLKASIMNVGEYRAVLAALKASQPTKAELSAIVEELTGAKAASSSTIRDLFRAIERHGASERRNAARAKVSRPVLPA